jgi:4-aminobutyrate aminotransferase
VDDRETRTPALEAGKSILYRALNKGLSFKLTMGNVLTLTPPLTITESEMDSALDIIEECLSEEQAARR